MRVFILEMEHPFQGSNKLSVHWSKLGADTRAAELVNMIVPELFETFGESIEDDEPMLATAENWEEIEDRYSKQEWVQDDGFGRWGGHVEEMELEQ
jgi:hypothetical protein